MVTRYRVSTNRPTQRYTLSVSTISPIPKSYNHAFQDPHWYRALLDEYNALIKNNTWIIVPQPSNANIVRSLWLFQHKYNADGTLNRYKARLVANGSTQLTGIDVDETFSPVVKPTTIRMRSLYGLKQAPQAWFHRFAAYAAGVAPVDPGCLSCWGDVVDPVSDEGLTSLYDSSGLAGAPCYQYLTLCSGCIYLLMLQHGIVSNGMISSRARFLCSLADLCSGGLVGFCLGIQSDCFVVFAKPRFVKCRLYLVLIVPGANFHDEDIKIEYYFVRDLLPAGCHIRFAVTSVVVVRPVNTRHRWDETCLLDIIVIKSTDVVGSKFEISGNNFNDWFARLKLVLRVEKKMHVIEQPLPPAPEPVAEPQIVAEWTALYDAHTEIACLMLGSMTSELHRQFELYYPYDMIQELRSMFEKQASIHVCKTGVFE
ncbi:ribonuclease H-like domain-containing protein [Tanacetum coccineum]|uniref:Ribonuclease H-like domain-containing protein n=1 Tax=Tanacetum coccineum TaxID=301880 RepID=A0ABQ5A7F7_9ASTR